MNAYSSFSQYPSRKETGGLGNNKRPGGRRGRICGRRVGGGAGAGGGQVGLPDGGCSRGRFRSRLRVMRWTEGHCLVRVFVGGEHVQDGDRGATIVGDFVRVGDES